MPTDVLAEFRVSSRARTATVAVVLATWLVGCNPPPTHTIEELERARPPEAFSLLGEPLAAPALSDSQRERAEAELGAARREYEVMPNDADTIATLGRRTAALNRFAEAIDIYSLGIDKHPDDARFYRYRGHLLLITRRLAQATADLETAAKLAADGPELIEPEASVPKSQVSNSLPFNIWYHLGLTCYLTGDLPNAHRAYRHALEMSSSPDTVAATTYWLYLTLLRLGDEPAATAALEQINADMPVTHQTPYHRLLLMYKGLDSPDALLNTASESADAVDRATIRYGVGSWYEHHGRQAQAIDAFRQVVDAGPWTALSALAAEVDLVRLEASSTR